MARVTDFEPTIEEFLGQVGNKRIQRYGKTKSKLPKDLPKVKVTEPYIQPEPYSSDMGISRERFPVTQSEFKGYSPEMESALNRYGTPNRPLEELASREAGLSIPEKVPYTQPRTGLVNWESPSIGGVSANSINPSEIQKSFNQFQTSQLPQGKGITAINPNTFGTGIVDTLKGYGSSIADSKVGKIIGKEVGILGEALNNPLVSKTLKGLGSASAMNAGFASQYAPAIMDEGISRAIKQGSLPNLSYDPNEQYNPPPNQNGKLGEDQAGLIANSTNVPPVQTSPFKDAGLPDAQIQALLQQTQPTVTEQPKTNILGEQVPMNQLPKGIGYVNGKLFDSNKQSTQGMFAGYSKERDAALDKYGKVDKNSEFYKRNKQAMSNLGGGYAEEQNMLNAQRSKDNQDAMDLARFRY